MVLETEGKKPCINVCDNCSMEHVSGFVHLFTLLCVRTFAVVFIDIDLLLMFVLLFFMFFDRQNKMCFSRIQLTLSLKK